MNREIKFRCWIPSANFMGVPFDPFDFDPSIGGFPSDAIFTQFTGLKDKEETEIYEGDIFRVEEDAAPDGTDLTYYLVIVWVQEWCMFCTLTSGEYKRYLIEGITALDEPMFWTYTLEDTNDRRFFLCGNIFEHRHLLEK